MNNLSFLQIVAALSSIAFADGFLGQNTRLSICQQCQSKVVSDYARQGNGSKNSLALSMDIGKFISDAFNFGSDDEHENENEKENSKKGANDNEDEYGYVGTANIFTIKGKSNSSRLEKTRITGFY